MVVWIAKSFTDQHRTALDWLNEVSETRTRFFGLEIELVITGQDTDHYFDLLHANRHDVEEEHEFSDEMEWYNPTGAQQRKIYWRLPTDFGDRDLRTDQYRWLLERVEALHRILAARVMALRVPE